MSNLKFYKGFFVIVLLIIGALVVYNYIYKSHRNIETETTSFVSTASDLVDEFVSDIETSTEKYLDKVVEISGFVTKVDHAVLEIDNNVSCYFDKAITNTQLLNKKIIIKGRCIGFDELLDEIKMDQCTVLKID
jgi:hypothetical protein